MTSPRTPMIISLYYLCRRIQRSLIAYARKSAHNPNSTRKQDEGKHRRIPNVSRHSKHYIRHHLGNSMNIPTFNPRFKAKELFNKYTKQKEKGIHLGSKWNKYKNLYLKQHPYCAKCKGLAEEVHHILPRADHPDKVYDWHNLQSLCRACHIDTHKGGKRE